MAKHSKTTRRLCQSLGVAVLGAAILGMAGRHPSAVGDLAPWPALTFTPADRILVLAPHPDDEVLGCGGVIQEALRLHLPLKIVFLTYGDNNQWSFLVYRKHPVLRPEAVRRMGLIRHDEALAAARMLGVAPEALTFLGYPDYGTLRIWEAHWGDRPPFKSLLTREAAVPYPNALRPGAPHKGEDILRDLTDTIRAFRPTKIFVSHPADHNPDHRALYLFTRVALWDVEAELRPAVYPYLIHYQRWPRPRSYRPDAVIAPPSSLKGDIDWRVLRMSPEETERNRAALEAHRSQYISSRKYLLSFLRANHLFGDFPIVTLHPNAPPTLLSETGATTTEQTPEELTDQERARFVGFEQRAVHLDNGRLVLRVTFSRPLAETVDVSVWVFGYRHDRPFAQMPKLHIHVNALTQDVDDQGRPLPDRLVTIDRYPQQLVLHIPLAALGEPETMLTSAQTRMGTVPLDWVSWRILQ